MQILLKQSIPHDLIVASGIPDSTVFLITFQKNGKHLFHLFIIDLRIFHIKRQDSGSSVHIVLSAEPGRFLRQMLRVGLMKHFRNLKGKPDIVHTVPSDIPECFPHHIKIDL